MTTTLTGSRLVKLLSFFAIATLMAASCGDSDDAADADLADETTEAAADDTATDDTATDDTATDDTATDDTATDAAAEETTVDDAAVDDDSASDEVVEESVDLRVVSLSPTHTEIMFAIGAGDLLVAVDEFSDYPAEALELPNELSGFEPNVEAIASFEPDLVLIGGDNNGLGDQLAELDIESWDGPAAVTIADTYAQIEQLGVVTGQVAQAAELVASMQTRIDAALAEAPDAAVPITIYHELDPTLYTADSTTFIGEVYSSFGLVNIADRAEGDNFGFPQLNAEILVEADPDIIFLADTKCCGENAASVAARPGWDALSAVQTGNIVEMDDDIASRWGPRIADYYEAVAEALAALTVGAS